MYHFFGILFFFVLGQIGKVRPEMTYSGICQPVPAEHSEICIHDVLNLTLNLNFGDRFPLYDRDRQFYTPTPVKSILNGSQ